MLDGRRRVNPAQQVVSVDGEKVEEAPERLVLALNKPRGYVTTRDDPGGRPTVYDLLGDVDRWVFPVGRLDRDSSGLLIFTNDHALACRLTDPDGCVPKTYHARLRGIPIPEALVALAEGVPLPGGATTRPARVRSLGVAQDGSAWIELVLTEGKNRQVRRMCAAVGHDVLELVRVAIGSLTLGHLELGHWRRVSEREIAARNSPLPSGRGIG